MSRHVDPPRWTADPYAAPEELRAAFSAGRVEGPNARQMTALTARLAAISAGSAVIATAGNANAAKVAASKVAATKVVSSGSLAALKAAVSVAAVVTATTSAIVWYQSSWSPGYRVRDVEVSETEAASVRSSAAAAARAHASHARRRPASAGEQTSKPRPTVEPAVPAAETAAPKAPAAKGGEPTVSETTGSSATVELAASRDNRRPRKRASEQTAKPLPPTRAKPATRRQPQRARRAVKHVQVAEATRSEMELLREARRALTATPARTLALTKQHLRLYPEGAFSEERDALTIQALLRAGWHEKAQDLAREFVEQHPESPLSHQLRESLEL